MSSRGDRGEDHRRNDRRNGDSQRRQEQQIRRRSRSRSNDRSYRGSGRERGPERSGERNSFYGGVGGRDYSRNNNDNNWNRRRNDRGQMSPPVGGGFGGGGSGAGGFQPGSFSSFAKEERLKRNKVKKETKPASEENATVSSGMISDKKQESRIEEKRKRTPDYSSNADADDSYSSTKRLKFTPEKNENIDELGTLEEGELSMRASGYKRASDVEKWNKPRNYDEFPENVNFNDRRFPRFNRDFGNNRRFGSTGGYSGNYGPRGSSYGRRGSNRGRGGRIYSSVSYRSAEDDDKPKLNLFDPRDVPKGRSYFEHDDRSGGRMGRGGRGRGGSFGQRPRSNYQEQRMETGEMWSHDMFETNVEYAEGEEKPY